MYSLHCLKQAVQCFLIIRMNIQGLSCPTRETCTVNQCALRRLVQPLPMCKPRRITSGAMWMNIMALAWPQRESCSSCVSLELRKGTCFVLRCASAAMTSPSALKLLLMCFASSSLSPVASLLPTLSLPAQ